MLSVTKQCRLLGIARSSMYYQCHGETEQNLRIMRLIDEEFMEDPSYGTRTMRSVCRRKGFRVSRKRIQRLMRMMGLSAIYQKPRTTVPHPEHKIYPYLLKGLSITRPNQVWCADITYIPMKRGFLYLVAVMDWYSRKVLSWRISNTMEADLCCLALQEAIVKHGSPDIFNTDQGSQFTSGEFTRILKDNGIQISMDGKGRWMDNVMVERLWRSVKYGCVYLHAFETGSQLRQGLAKWFRRYNFVRPHSSLGDLTPDEVYFSQSPPGVIEQPEAA